MNIADWGSISLNAHTNFNSKFCKFDPSTWGIQLMHAGQSGFFYIKNSVKWKKKPADGRAFEETWRLLTLNLAPAERFWFKYVLKMVQTR